MIQKSLFFILIWLHKKCLLVSIKNGHFIGFKPLVYSILVLFFRLKNPKDTEVFLALKMDELIQNLNCLLNWFWNWFQLNQFWVNRKPFWYKSLYFLSWFDYTKIPSDFNEKCLQISFKNGWINSEFKLFIELVLKLVSVPSILN